MEARRPRLGWAFWMEGLRALQRLGPAAASPVAARGAAAVAVWRAVRAAVGDRLLGGWRRELPRVLSSEAGREWLADVLAKELGRLAKPAEGGAQGGQRGGASAEDLRRVLVERLGRLASELPKLSGREAQRRLEELLVELGLGRGEARRVVEWAGLRARIVKLGRGGEALFDPVEGALYRVGGVERGLDGLGYEQLVRKLGEHGIELSVGEYYELVDSALAAKALALAGGPREARELYQAMHAERCARDPVFAAAFRERSWREVSRAMSVGAVLSAVQDAAVALPSRLVASLSRMLARAVSALPVVGAVAGLQFEAAAALAEVGEGVRGRLEAAASAVHSLASLAPSLAEQASLQAPTAAGRPGEAQPQAQAEQRERQREAEAG